MDKVLDRRSESDWYCISDGHPRDTQISIAPNDQEKTTLACRYGNLSFKGMPFQLCDAQQHFNVSTCLCFFIWYNIEWKSS